MTIKDLTAVSHKNVTTIGHKEYFEVFEVVFEKTMAEAKLQKSGKISVTAIDRIVSQTVGNDDRWMDCTDFEIGAPYELLTK